MSTRSVTTINGVYGSVALYRHCDGYPGEAGASLVEAVTGAQSAELAASRLLALRYEHSAGGNSRGMYELTTAADDHGDLEHAYEVRAQVFYVGNTDRVRRLRWFVNHSKRVAWDGPNQWQTAVLDLPQFVDVVNRDRAEMNARMDARGMDCERYPMLPAPEGVEEATEVSEIK
jgi:hypothetical protein